MIKCDTCHICIGYEFEEHYTTTVGEKELCGFCYSHLEKYGFLQLTEQYRFLPDGSTIRAGALSPVPKNEKCPS